jgi:hypothetical protein
MFENNGTLLGTKASVAVVEQGLLWRIDDPDAARAPYTVWAIAQTMVIKVRPALPTVERVFKDQFAVELRPQVTISAGAGQAAGSWIVDNDSTNPQNLTTGYVKFVVTRPAGSALSVYGTQLHATRGFNQQEMTVVEMKLTVLRDGAGTTYLAPTTVCPNGIPYGQQGRISWEECLRAREAPPKPPTCVPSPIAPCRTPKSFV